RDTGAARRRREDAARPTKPGPGRARRRRKDAARSTKPGPGRARQAMDPGGPRSSFAKGETCGPITARRG
ncbi:hypothetical protein MCOR08_011865, partial [Pyricularia oryzae]